MKNKDVVVVIPTLNPNEKIMDEFINKLKKLFSNILIVDDGCREKSRKYLQGLESSNIKVITNYKNYGKGRALKYALNHILNNYKDCKAIVTADCDGQHSPEDILKVANKTKENPKAYVLGCRDFKKSNVPFKSRYGNIITRNIFKIFIGIKITDTQTGLRGMSPKVAEYFLDTAGERFEYETNTLIECKEKDIPIVEETIETIYINDNSESHFNPLKDSIRIYKLFIKYIFSAISSFALDILLFAIFMKVLPKDLNNKIVISTIMARVISSLYNYLVNSKLVFKKSKRSSIIKYFVLVIVQMFASGFIVDALSKHVFSFSPTIIKIIVDSIIFVVNFFIQREWVFKNN
ncbi:MAG: bifunctional glycosyltransferase family 2/GtrA family protein [Bacilli bacterium]|nr:bifunctional glycosyltransferase family 2/GtrA family protein [Bacilli bacterium]